MYRIQRQIPGHDFMISNLESLDELKKYSFKGEGYVNKHVQFAAGNPVNIFLESEEDKIRISADIFKTIANDSKDKKEIKGLVDEVIKYIDDNDPRR